MGAGGASRVIELDEAVDLADAQGIGGGQDRRDVVDRPHEIIPHQLRQLARTAFAGGPFGQALEVIPFLAADLGHQHRLGPSLQLVMALEIPHPDADPLELILRLGDDLHPPTLPKRTLTASGPPDRKRASAQQAYHAKR